MLPVKQDSHHYFNIIGNEGKNVRPLRCIAMPVEEGKRVPIFSAVVSGREI